MQPVRFHHLKAVARAAQLGKFVLDGGEAQEETYSMEKGTALHTVLFGTKPITYYPKARDERHSEWRAFKETYAEYLIVTPSEYELAHRMAEAVHANDDARGLLTGCVYEKTLYFEWLGRKCRVTPDAQRSECVVELKQSKTAHPDEFPRILERMHYHTQTSWQRTGVKLALGYEPKEAFIIAVEPKPPYLVCPFRIKPRMLEMGARTLRLWMERLVACEASGEWPGYSQSIVDVDLPEEENWEEEAA